MERDYGILSRLVEEDQKQKKNPSEERKSKVDALKRFLNKFSSSDKLELDVESPDNDSLRLKEGMREYNRKKQDLERMFKG